MSLFYCILSYISSKALIKLFYFSIGDRTHFGLRWHNAV